MNNKHQLPRLVLWSWESWRSWFSVLRVRKTWRCPDQGLISTPGCLSLFVKCRSCVLFVLHRTSYVTLVFTGIGRVVLQFLTYSECRTGFWSPPDVWLRRKLGITSWMTSGNHVHFRLRVITLWYGKYDSNQQTRFSLSSSGRSDFFKTRPGTCFPIRRVPPPVIHHWRNNNDTVFISVTTSRPWHSRWCNRHTEMISRWSGSKINNVIHFVFFVTLTTDEDYFFEKKTTNGLLRLGIVTSYTLNMITYHKKQKQKRQHHVLCVTACKRWSGT